MPCIQIDRAKGGWCLQITLILYLRLMNICGTMASNLSGDSMKGGGKSFYGELKEDGTFYVLPISECLPDAMAFHGVLSLLNFQILWCSQKTHHQCSKSSWSFSGPSPGFYYFNQWVCYGNTSPQLVLGNKERFYWAAPSLVFSSHSVSVTEM